MFEERAKVKVACVMSGEEEAHGKVWRLASKDGLNKADSILEWVAGRSNHPLSTISLVKLKHLVCGGYSG